MEYLNDLIQSTAVNGFNSVIYRLNMLLACLLALGFNYWNRKNYGISTRHYTLAMLLAFPLGYLWMLVYAWIENGFTGWGTMNIVRIFVYYPLFILPVAKYSKHRLVTILDFLSPGLALLQAVDHISCAFSGCCHGFPAAWGIWNPVTETRLVPVQWMESLAAFVIFFILLRSGKKRNYPADGSLYALFLILFGSTRFLLEFLRDNEKLFWGISNLALHAAFMVLMGIGWKIYIRKEAVKTPSVTA